ncbi:ATP-dependent DNA helicase pif1 [Metarhizium anisopliae]|nr:ATP-dependent DNA helicase pif1 [Metarhizium anisopliae]
MTRRKSTNPTTTCLKCRDYRNSERARSRGAIQILRNLAVRPERPAPKRTDREAGLSPGKERSGTQPTSPERLRHPPTARRLFGEPISQPRVVLGTPIPPTQSSPLYRTLAPSPPVQPTTYPIASHPDPSTIRSSIPSIPSVDYSYLAARFHRGGKVSQDDASKAWARAKQAAIQRDHRSRRRAGQTVSLTPTISQLGAIEDFEGPGEGILCYGPSNGGQEDRLRPNGSSAGDGMNKEGDDGGQFSESDIDVEDYFNLLLSPTRPRGYLEQLGIESDSDPGDEDEGDNNDGVDESPLRRRLRQIAVQSRRGRRGPAPGTGGRPRKSRRQSRSSIPPRRVRSPVIIPPEESAVFHAQDPVWNGDLDASALSDRDKATLREFWTMLDNDQMEYCSRCQESWFQMKIDTDGICGRCYRRDAKRRPGEPYFFSADNQLDFGPVPARLPQLTPTEESLIARVHVHVNIMLVRGQQYMYRGHVVHFLREVGLVYNQLPLLPQELNTVLLRPANTSSHANLSRQFTRQFRVRRQPVTIWLNYLRRHHPGYRCIIIDEDRLSQLPEDGNVLDAIPQSQVEAADVGPEEDQEAEPDVEDEAAVPDLLAKDTELDALRSILAGEPEVNPGLATVDAQTRPELQLPNIRRTPINEFNRSHALLSLAFPCLFPDGRADFVEPRLRSIDYKDYVEHAMRWHDGRFARHPTFRFVAFNTMMRSQARARSNFFVKQHHGMHQPLTREQLIQALEHSDDPEAQALINSITRHAVSIRGTRPFWNRKRQDLEAYAYNLGCPGAFITFSPADLHWRSLYQHMPRYEEWLAASEPERMALSRHLLRQNPHIAAFHFYRRYCFFRDIVLSKKFKITDYWDRYEWQGRGSPHNHGLYWMENCPRVDMEDEAARDVFARTWGFHITPINPEPSRTVPQGEGNPLSVDPLSVEMTFLRLSQIVNRCQRHKCNTTYCLRARKRTGDLARDMEGAAADIEAANAANPEKECRFNFPRALRELAAVIRKEGKSYHVFEAARNDNLMNHFNPAIILGWLANIDISPCTSLQAVITYAAKYCSKSEKKTEPYCKLADQVLPHTAHLQPLLSFSSRLMNKLIAERDYSAQEISHLLLNIPLQEGTRMVVSVDCRPLEQHARSYRVDEDVNETIGNYRKYLERNDQHEDITYLEYLQSYNLKTWRRLAGQAKKRVLSYFPRYRSMEASSQFDDFCRVKLMMAHPHRSPEDLYTVGGHRFDSFAAAYKCCREHHDTHSDDHYGEPDTNELRAEDDEFELEVREEPVVEEDWHELAHMLPDRPLEEGDIDILGRRDIDVDYDWTPHVGRYTDDGILNGDYWKQRKAANRRNLDVDHQPLEARDSLNRDQRLVYDTVMDHFLTQESSQLLLHVDGGGGTGKSYLINLLSAHLQAAAAGRGTPVWRAAPTGVAGNQISGTTLHSLLHLPINKDFKPLSALDKTQLQKKLKDIKYLIIDEKSMLGLRQLSWIDDRIREAFPNKNEEFFGGLNILLVGDFFQLPPVLQKPLYYDKEVQGVEIKGRNAYRRFDKSVFLKVVQRQRGDDQKAFRTALGELRLLQLSVESWKLLSGRVQAKLDDQEVARFANALRVYATKDRVNEYNHYHLDRLSRPVIQVKAKNVGHGAAAAPDDKAGNLAKQIPICVGARLMLTSNLWQPVGLCNGARGTVYDIGWAPGADPVQDPPCVIMMEFDKYNGPVFLTTADGRKIVPILPVERDFLIGSTLCTRTQFPLIVCYAITVHKSQSITEDVIVTDLSCRDFQTGLSYVAVSRVKTLEGLMLDAPFDRSHLFYESPPDGMKMKMRDQELRKRQVLKRNPYKIDHGSA